MRTRSPARSPSGIRRGLQPQEPQAGRGSLPAPGKGSASSAPAAAAGRPWAAATASVPALPRAGSEDVGEACAPCGSSQAVHASIPVGVRSVPRVPLSSPGRGPRTTRSF